MLYYVCTTRKGTSSSTRILTTVSFVPGGQWDEGNNKKEAIMDIFNKHVNYNDLLAHEAIAMVAVAVLSIATGVTSALNLVA
jgi:hypothetical protein